MRSRAPDSCVAPACGDERSAAGLQATAAAALAGEAGRVSMTAMPQDFMRLALAEAENARAVGEVPVGAVVVQDGVIWLK